MNRHRGSFLWAITTLLLGGLFAFPADGQRKTAPPQPAGTETQERGTGAVPPGVKLVPAMPTAGSERAFHFPAAATRTLENGLRVFVVTDRRQPAVAVRLVLMDAGTIHDPVGLPGIASMTATMLTQGTEKRTAQQFAQEIDFVGGQISARAGRDSTVATLDIVNKDLGLGLGLLSDAVLHPAFRSEELARQRQQLLSSLRVEYADAGYLAGVSFDRLVYGSSPYGLPIEGTPDIAKKIDRQALVQFHDSVYIPNESLLAFAGDITPQAAFAAAEKYFGAWPKKDASRAESPAPAPVTGLHIFVIDKPDAVQTQIRVGKLGIRRNDFDYIPLLVTNRIFGGGFNSRLNTEVRVRKGLTYGASSSFDPHRFAGSFVARTFTRTEATVKATKLVVDLIAKMSTGDVTPAELKFAQDYLAGVYPIQSETADQVADRVLTVAEFGLPADYNDTYQPRILAVTSAEVRHMAERYFNPRDLDVVLVGNASKFADALKAAFPTAQWEEIPYDQLDLLSADLRWPKTEAPAVTPESLARGKEIVLAAAAAAGGDSLDKVKSLELTSAGQLTAGPGQSFPATVKLQIAYPDHIHLELSLPILTQSQGFDGKSGWIASPRGSMDMPSTYNGEFERGLELAGGLGLYQLARAGKVQAQAQGQEEIDGKKLEAVLWNAPFGPLKLYFDPATHLLVAAHYSSLSPQGAVETDQRWSDFRAVEGVQFPFHSVTLRDGAKFLETTVQDLKVNPPLDASVFSKPQPKRPPK